MTNAIPDTYGEFSVSWSNLSGASVPTCVLGVKFDVIPTTANLFSVAQWFIDTTAPIISEDLAFEHVQVTIGDSAGPPYLSVGVDIDLPATGNWGGASPSECWLFRKVTADPGRRGRGRFYLPGTNEAAVDGGGLINTSMFADLVGVQEILTAGTGAPAEYQGFALLHPLGSPNETPSLVIDIVAQARIATQRRRLRS